MINRRSVLAGAVASGTLGLTGCTAFQKTLADVTDGLVIVEESAEALFMSVEITAKVNNGAEKRQSGTLVGSARIGHGVTNRSRKSIALDGEATEEFTLTVDLYGYQGEGSSDVWWDVEVE